MKLIERIIKEYTQPLNEARAKKWTDDDPYWSKNITRKVAAKGYIKVDITDIWRFAFPSKKYQDGKADGVKDTFGDQNKRQHAFWKKRYDIEITGYHFDALAKNGKGAVVYLVYNRGGIAVDMKLVGDDAPKGYVPRPNASKATYVKYKDSKHKVFMSGEKQDIYDFFVSPEWTKSNQVNQNLVDLFKALGVK